MKATIFMIMSDMNIISENYEMTYLRYVYTHFYAV